MRQVLYIGCALASALTLAATTVTEQPGQYELRDNTNTVVRETVNGREVPLRRTTYDECKQAAQAEFEQRRIETDTFKCVHSGSALVFTASCGPRPPAPEFIPELLEPTYCPAPNEFKYQILETEQVWSDIPDCKWTVTKKIVASCDPVPIAYDYDDPADPPLEQMASYPIAEPGSPVDFE